MQVDLDGAEIGRNRAVDVGIVGDTGLVLRGARAGGPTQRAADAWLAEVRAEEDKQRAKMRVEMESDADAAEPAARLRRARTASSRTTPCDRRRRRLRGDRGLRAALECAAALDGSRPARHARRRARLRDGGASSRDPNSRVVLVYGDGSFGLHGLEFEAMVRQKLPVVGVIGNDAAWTQIRRGQVDLYGEERAVATDLEYTRYDKVVEAVGGHGEYVESPAELGPALDARSPPNRPALVNVRIGRSDFRKGAISV